MNAIWLYLLLNSIALRILFAFTPQHERKIGRTIKLKNGQMHTHTDFFSIKMFLREKISLAQIQTMLQ